MTALRAAGVAIVDDEPLDGFDRVYVADPFGNRLELMERAPDPRSLKTSVPYATRNSAKNGKEPPMLQLFGFDRIGVVVGDLYFVDPDPTPGQKGAGGVHVEVRFLDRQDLPGSIYSAQPITVGLPIWRADLLESVEGPFGSFDRTHHHPAFREWEPGHRVFVPEMSADPIEYVGERLRDIAGLCEGADLDPALVPTGTTRTSSAARCPTSRPRSAASWPTSRPASWPSPRRPNP